MTKVAQIAATYDYTDENGKMLFQAVRMVPKDFRQRQPDGRGGWIWNLQGVRLVPYRLPEISGRDTLFIVEGEKDAETLRAHGLMATCNPMGAGRWKADYTTLVMRRGVRDVIALPDNDTPGKAHIDAVVASFKGTPCNVRCLELPGLAHKGDVSDWFASGGTVERLGALAADAPYVLREGQAPDAADHSEVTTVTVAVPKYGTLDAEDGPEEEPITFPDTERPAPLGDALYGLAGDWVTLAAPITEADPAALLVSVLVGIGNIVGRDLSFDAGGSLHRLNLFAVLVGDTAKGRKGTSWALASQLLRLIDPVWVDERVTPGGLASGEGLIRHLQEDDAGIVAPRTPARRRLIIEAEFGRILQVLRRDGSTLSGHLRSAWDGQTLKNVTKENPLSAEHAHLSVIAHVTTPELLRLLQDADTFNGFANRFLWVYTQRQRILPNAERVPATPEQVIAEAMRENIRQAVAHGPLDRSPSMDRWKSMYAVLTEDRPGVLGAVTSRAEAQVLRVAAIYAALDGTRSVRNDHLEAAADLWRYCEQSARFVFGESFGDGMLDEAWRLLREAGHDGLTRTELHAQLGRNRSSAELTRILRELQRLGRARGTRIRSGIGRPTERWRAVQSASLLSRCRAA